MGLFALVCHTHLPYLRRNGVWPVGEDLFHQAASESYLPLLGVLERLGNDGISDAFTLGLSPMVAAQMADPHMLEELSGYLARFETRAWQTVANYGRREHPEDSPALYVDEVKKLAGWNATWARSQAERLESLLARHGDLARAFAAHRNVIEILGGPATHPLLPRVSDPGLQRLQLELGLTEGQRLTGQRADGIWLPECYFAPDTGLESLFDSCGVSHLVLDGPTVIRGLGRDATFRPWTIKGTSTTAFGRDLDTTYRVWSPTGGYPTGAWYRDFFHYDLEGGFKNWRVTAKNKPLHHKMPYEPERAQQAAKADAADFVNHLVRRMEEYERATGRVGLIVAAYDTELFGHWWFEGPTFLEEVIRLLQHTPSVRAVSLSKARELMPEADPAAFEEGSWGFRKDLRSWITPETEPMLESLARTEQQTCAWIRKEREHATGARKEALAQVLRELLLLGSSDWPFKVVRGRNVNYAWQRFEGHRRRIKDLVEVAQSRIPDDLIAQRIAEVQEIDNVFPALQGSDLP